MQQWQVPVTDSESTSIIYERADTPTGSLLVCAHGAGGNMHDRGMSSLTRCLRSHGLDIVRFNFLYTEKGSGRPDPMPRLEQCFAAVVEHVRREVKPARLYMGGRSMGGRAATMMASRGYPCDGLILFAYPLHPAGQPEKLRDAHLPDITTRVICFNGTRDALCTQELMTRALEPVQAPWTMHWIEGADHSFHVLKSSGRTDAEVLEEVGAATEAWLKA